MEPPEKKRERGKDHRYKWGYFLGFKDGTVIFFVAGYY
jgi:hypothetical protein